MVSMLALLLLAVRIGEVRGMYTMDRTMDHRYDMKNQGRFAGSASAADGGKLRNVATAEEWKDFPCFDFVGAGFDYAAAWFGQAKSLEAIPQGKIFHAYQLGGMVSI